MRSRILSRVIAEQLAIQLITSRSHVSNAKAISTSSPYQHLKERVSEHQRIFDWRVITCSSCSSPQSKPVHLVLLRYRRTTRIMTISKDKIEVVTSVQRRKRWSAAEKKAIVQETFEAGRSVSYVVRLHGIAPSQLFYWRRRKEEGALTGVGSEEAVVPVSQLKAVEARIRQLERIIGQKTVDIEILKEAVMLRREKKLISRQPLVGLEDFE